MAQHSNDKTAFTVTPTESRAPVPPGHASFDALRELNEMPPTSRGIVHRPSAEKTPQLLHNYYNRNTSRLQEIARNAGQSLRDVGGMAKDTVTGYPQQFYNTYSKYMPSFSAGSPQNPNRPLEENVPWYRALTTPAPRGISAEGKVIPGTAADLRAGYDHALDKFYNPYSKAWKEPNIDRDLVYTGRGAMATGASAATAAALISSGALALPGMAARSAYGLGSSALGAGRGVLGYGLGLGARGLSNVRGLLGSAAKGIYDVGSTALAQKALTPLAYGVGTTGLLGAGYGTTKGYQWYNSKTPEQQAAAAAVAEKLKKDVNVATGKQLLWNGALGLGIGGGATALYYYMHRRRKQQEEKRRLEQAQLLEKGDLKFANFSKTAEGFLDDWVYGPIGGSGQDVLVPNIPGINEERKPVLGGMTQGGALIAVPLIASAAGLYGAHQLMRAREKQVDVDQAADSVIEAKKDYMRALNGDKAASLDAAYEKYAAQSKTAVTDPDAKPSWSNFPEWIGQNLYATGLLSGAAGLGVGAHFMYHKTKKDLANNNLATAAETRARLRALPAPWIDPAELAALQQQLRESKS